MLAGSDIETRSLWPLLPFQDVKCYLGGGVKLSYANKPVPPRIQQRGVGADESAQRWFKRSRGYRDSSAANCTKGSIFNCGGKLQWLSLHELIPHWHLVYPLPPPLSLVLSLTQSQQTNFFNTLLYTPWFKAAPNSDGICLRYIRLDILVH
jgi:hypothetical protein